MFGYVLPRTATLERRDFAMFQAAYCGICLSTKKKYGNLARLTTNYDVTVLELLAIEALKPDVEFGTCRCICDPRRKVFVKDNVLSQTIVDANILLCRYKLVDDDLDGGGRHGMMRRIIKKPYLAAKANLPAADRIVADGYARLRAMEKENVASLDRTADCFAKLLADLLVAVLDKAAAEDVKYKEQSPVPPLRPERLADGSEYMTTLRALCYNVGKFVYLADALDDLEEDAAAKRYNPVLAVYPDYEQGKRLDYIDRHHAELKFAFTSTVNRAIEALNCLPLTHVGDLLRNIVYDGLRAKTNELFSAKRKLPPPVLYAPAKKKNDDPEQGQRKRK